jgi:hypothetical protein
VKKNILVMFKLYNNGEGQLGHVVHDFFIFQVTEAQNIISMGWAPIQLPFFAVHFKDSDLQPIKKSVELKETLCLRGLSWIKMLRTMVFIICVIVGLISLAMLCVFLFLLGLNASYKL